MIDKNKLITKNMKRKPLPRPKSIYFLAIISFYFNFLKTIKLNGKTAKKPNKITE